MDAAFAASPSALALVDENKILHLATPSLGNLVGVHWEELLGTNYLDLFPGEQQRVMQERIENPPDGNYFFPITLQHRDGSERELDARCYRLEVPGEHWTVVVLVDMTSERRLLRKLSGISTLASSLAYAGSLRETLDGLALRVVETTDATSSAVLLCDEDSEHMEFRVGGAHGHPPERLLAMEEAYVHWQYAEAQGRPLPAAQARQTRQPIYYTWNDQLVAELEDDAPGGITQLADMTVKSAWKSMVALPMLLGSRFLGTLNCYYRTEAPPEPVEMTFLRTLADLAAVAVENARLVQESERQAILQERRRLARELHDSVSQALYGIALGAKTVKARWDSHPLKAQQALDYVIELADGAGSEMRALLYSLRPESLEEEGLRQALRRQAEALQARYGMEVLFVGEEEPRLNPDQRLALFRVASEALHNVVKHSCAKHVSISLHDGNHQCVVEVRDDGVGFDYNPYQTAPDHYGLASMRERMEALGGTWELISAPGQGTHICARLPLHRSQENHSPAGASPTASASPETPLHS